MYPYYQRYNLSKQNTTRPNVKGRHFSGIIL